MYIGTSGIEGAGQGLFARRTFLPGEIVSYFNGVRVTESQIYLSNMTQGPFMST